MVKRGIISIDEKAFPLMKPKSSINKKPKFF
jgi:hypothetical protein